MTLVEEGRLRLNDTVAITHPGIRALRKRRHPDSPSIDPCLRVATRRRSASVDRIRRGDRAREGRSADIGARRSIRLQRHQLLSARRHRQAHHRPVARRVSESARVRAARHDGDRFPAAEVAAAAHRADRAMRRAGCVALQASGCDAAARCRARPDRAAHGRHRRSRGSLQHRARSQALRANAARQRPARHHARAVGGDGDGDDVAADARRA